MSRHPTIKQLAGPRADISFTVWRASHGLTIQVNVKGKDRVEVAGRLRDFADRVEGSFPPEAA